MQFKDKLKELRIKNNESQRDLAEILNISFQSVSKWEQGFHYPDIQMMKNISDHYNVSIDYLINNEIKTIKKEFEVSINEPGKITVWTDFTYMNSISPISNLDNTRHAPGNRYYPTHPGPKDTIAIGVDENNQICFLGDHVNNNIPSCGKKGFIYLKYGSEDTNCILLNKDFIKDGLNKSDYIKEFEFVVPKNGFLIVLPKKLLVAKEVLSFILPPRIRIIVESIYPILGNNDWHVFKDVLLSDELDNISVSLENNKILLTKTKEQTNETLENDDLYIQIQRLTTKISELEKQINDINDHIDDLENSIYDLQES